MGSNIDYHPTLAPLSWLFGVWESIEAEVFYPTMDTIKYSEVVEFIPTRQPLIEYKSETWHPVKKTKMHCEKGFIRIDPESGKLALLVAHNFEILKCLPIWIHFPKVAKFTKFVPNLLPRVTARLAEILVLGVTEVSEGSVDKEELCFESHSISRMSFTKVAATVKIVRKLALKGEELHSTVLLQTITQPLQDHLRCRYKKKHNK